MTIGGIEYEQIIITSSDGDVLAVISDAIVVEKGGVAVEFVKLA